MTKNCNGHSLNYRFYELDGNDQAGKIDLDRVTTVPSTVLKQSMIIMQGMKKVSYKS